MKEEILYSDLDLAMKPHPLTGDLAPKKNAEAIRRAIRNICRLDSFDIPFEPNLKTDLKRFLFEPVSHITAGAIQTNLEWAFKKLEPRAKIISIDVDPTSDQIGYNITVTFMIRSLMVEDKFTFFVKRVR